MSLGLFRMAIAIMLERTLSQFIKLTCQIEIPRSKALDALIRPGILAAVFEALLPVPAAIAVLALTAILLLARFRLWRPLKGMSQVDSGVMFVGYLSLLIILCLEYFRLAGSQPVTGNSHPHLYLLSMGLIMAGMMIRFSQRHMRRSIVFTRSDKAAIWIAALAG